MTQRAASAHPVQLGLGWLALALTPLALRALLVAELSGSWSWGDARGVVSDLAVAGLATVVLAVVARAGRVGRGLTALAAGAWALLHYANYEVVGSLGSLASVSDAHFLSDATFVRGSALALTHPVLLVVLVVGSALVAGWALHRPAPRVLGVAGLASLALLGVQTGWRLTDDLALWRQTDVLHENARRVALAATLGSAGPGSGHREAAQAMLELVPELRADLAGAPRVPLPGSARNVLLVILESVSGGYLESLAAAHDQRPGVSLAGLDAVAASNLSYATFFTHQRKTNRGLYALLCGELPNLGPGLPKMSASLEGDVRTCLPRILRDAGYETVYLQAAPLAFMLKDQFMPRAGFARVHGDEWFERAHARSVWGVDDRAFFEQSLGLVDELAAGPAPWFLTLLTVGTHHPFVFPDDFRPESRSRLKRALAYLDLAVSEFLAALEARGLREDTLVLVTSDESLGFPGPGGVVTRALSENWGFLIALLPERTAVRVDEPFAQSDLALSVLDYLGLAARGGHLFGRSVFRSDPRRRFVFFANTNHHFTGALDPFGRLLLCFDSFSRCRLEAPESGRVFSAQRRSLPVEEDAVQVLRELARRSVPADPTGHERREFRLVAGESIVVDTSRSEIVHGGQYVDVGPGRWLEVDFEVEARGGKGEVALSQALRSDELLDLGEWKARLRDGQTLRLRYTYAPDQDVAALEVRSYARSVDGEPVELVFKRARMSLRWSDAAPASGLSVQTFEVSPPL